MCGTFPLLSSLLSEGAVRGKDNPFQVVTKREDMGSASKRDVLKATPGVLEEANLEASQWAELAL